MTSANHDLYPARGLTETEAAARLAEFGPNVLPQAEAVPWWTRVLAQLRSSIIYILLFALAFDAVVWLLEGANEWPFESIAIATILVFNTAMGVWQEYRAEDALARLKELAAPQVWTLRDGHLVQRAAALLVPGDLFRVEAGDRLAADGTLRGEQAVQVDESVLTGESVPVERGTDDEVFSGTLAVRGLGWVEVTRTGSASSMGRIAAMLGAVQAEPTPLERRMEHFGHRIARWIAALAVVLTVTGVAASRRSLPKPSTCYASGWPNDKEPSPTLVSKPARRPPRTTHHDPEERQQRLDRHRSGPSLGSSRSGRSLLPAGAARAAHSQDEPPTRPQERSRGVGPPGPTTTHPGIGCRISGRAGSRRLS